MYKKLFSLVLIVGLCVAVVAPVAAQTAAQEKKESVLSSWLREIQKKIEQIVPKKAPPVTTGVAGIRGAKQEAQAKLYWKGKKGDEVVTEEELAKFKSGVDLALKGDRTASIKEIEDFMKQYPDSALIPDAKKTLGMVQAEGK